jgi:hypothetical protein
MWSDIVYDGPLAEDTYHANAGGELWSMERVLKIWPRIVHGGPCKFQR